MGGFRRFQSLALMSSGGGQGAPSRRRRRRRVASTAQVSASSLALVDPLQYTGRLAAVPPIVAFFGSCT